MFIASNGQHFILDKFKHAGVGIVPRPCTQGEAGPGPCTEETGAAALYSRRAGARVFYRNPSVHRQTNTHK